MLLLAANPALVPPPPTPATSRRAVLRTAAALPAFWLPASSLAFENRLPPDELELKYKNPRTPGPKPTDIGPRADGGLKSCTDGKPHCFSSTPETFEDNDLFNADYGTTEGWLVQPFKYDKSLAEAMTELKTIVASYPPGQGGIDGGGFKVAGEKAEGDTAYLYVLFESRRKGYVDDMEFSLAKGVCNVRTSSRLGYLDYGVNAKRYNWFANTLAVTPGWAAKPILSKGHEEYFALNGVTDKDVTSASSSAVVKAEKVKLEGSGKFGTVGV